MNKVEWLINNLVIRLRTLDKANTQERIERAEIIFSDVKEELIAEFTRLESENAILTGQHAMMHTEIERLKSELADKKPKNKKKKRGEKLLLSLQQINDIDNYLKQYEKEAAEGKRPPLQWGIRCDEC